MQNVPRLIVHYGRWFTSFMRPEISLRPPSALRLLSLGGTRLGPTSKDQIISVHHQPQAYM
jgi:hypothetical protein